MFMNSLSRKYYSSTLIRDFNDTFPVRSSSFIITHSVTPSLGIILITPPYNYSSLLIRDFDATFTVFSPRFIMKYSSLAIRDLSLIAREE